MKGKVTLVGAGPGDLGLLTLKGREALENAQVVVYDRLVGSDILSLIPKEAEKINAGKKCSEHLIPQKEINSILVEKAKEGKNVVRLKGGDCFVFGRGGEELIELRENGIEFEVVPGITSALAVPAYAGIPVTHRDFVSSVHIITGHLKENNDLTVDFDSLVKLKGTLIFLMGLKNIDFIVNGLISAGMSENILCAVIQNGTRNTQKTVLSPLNEISQRVKEEKIESPAIIAVGEVCSLKNKLDWFERLPLKGCKIIVTRPEDRISTLSERLKKLGAEVIENPCIKIKSSIGSKISFAEIKDKIKLSNWIVFTSPSGVDVFFRELKKAKLDARLFGDKKLAVIGSGTAKALSEYNLRYDLMPEEYYTHKLAYALCEKCIKGEKICILRAEAGSEELTDILAKNDIKFYDIGIYETIYENEDKNNLVNMINNGEIDFVTFTSKSTADAFAEITKGADRNKIKAVCIGEKTKKAAEEKGYRCYISNETTIASIIEKLKEMGEQK